VSGATLTKACKPDGKLRHAMVGDKIDADHEDVVRWTTERAVRGAVEEQLNRVRQAPPPTQNEVTLRTLVAATTSNEAQETPSAAELERDLGPLRERIDLGSLEQPLATLTERYGDAKEMSAWVQARKNLAAARREELQLSRVQGRLIARTTVQRMMDHLDAALRVLVNDTPRKIATMLGHHDPRILTVVRDGLEQQISAAKAQMQQSLLADDPLAPLQEAAE
jgi:ATP-dependent protease HslVU (ClpYQ) ATPase subunit